MRRMARAGALVVGLALAAGCKRGGDAPAAPPAAATVPPAPGSAPPPASAAPPVGPTAHPDAVVEAFTGAGLSPEGFAALNPIPYGAAACKEGRVQTIDTLVCEFRDPDALARGEAALLEHWGREGGHTGVALHSRLTLLGVFNRARHDPNGKVISKVIDTFKKL